LPQRREIAAVYAAGVVQGVALVTFPAASAIFTSPQYYGLSSTAYGAMFLPQAVLAVAAPLLGAGLSRRLGLKRVYLLGLLADLVAMGLLLTSQLVSEIAPLAYGLLLAATGSLGVGFGLTVPALNTYADAFFPQRADSAVLILNALLGLGTALAPVFVILFVQLGIWWGLPLLVAALLLGLLLFSIRLPLRLGTMDGAPPGRTVGAGRPARFWIYAAFAVLYGIVETTNGNWATLYMRQSLGATSILASLALTVFWATVTGGRVLFAAVERWMPQTRTYRMLPFVAAAALAVTAALPEGRPWLGVLAVGLAGVGCSALLPLTISFGQKELTAIAASVAGGLIAFYQIGYGIAAFGVGPLHEHAGLSLHAIFGATAMVALTMAALAPLVVRRDRENPPRR
jgi:fucose permease